MVLLGRLSLPGLSGTIPLIPFVCLLVIHVTSVYQLAMRICSPHSCTSELSGLNLFFLGQPENIHPFLHALNSLVLGAHAHMPPYTTVAFQRWTYCRNNPD